MGLEEIKKCKYIASVGMLTRMDDNEIITYHKEPNKITHDFSKLLNGKDGDCIYIKFAFIRQFIGQVLPQINYKFTLVTGDGDETMPYDMFNIDVFNSIINNEKIIHWYSVNCIEGIHPKFSLFPIGVNFHSLTFGEFSGWHPTAQSPLEQEAIIDDIKDAAPPFHERKIKCYSNFHFLKYQVFGNPRQVAIDKIPSDVVFYEPTVIPRFDAWKNQSEYAFVLSPLGHGMDCHRTWEALILGCIVIVKTSPLDSLYEGLPVLIVNEWDELNQTLLQETVDKFKDMTFDYSRITGEYWENKIRNTK
mgnify:FL=1